MATALDMIAALRALNAPPALGKFSAATSTPYQSPGVGVGGGNMLIMKDPQGVAAANAAWRGALEQSQGGGGGGYQGMVFGDTIGGAQGNLLNLRQQNISRALQQAALQAQQQARQDSLRQQQEYHNQSLQLGRENAQIADQRARTIAANQMGYNYDALAERDNSSYRNFLAQMAKLQSDTGLRSATESAQADVATKLNRALQQNSALDQALGQSYDQENALLEMLQNLGGEATEIYGAPMTVGKDGMPSFGTGARAGQAEQYMWGQNGGMNLPLRQQYDAILGGRTKLDDDREGLKMLIQSLGRQYSNPVVNLPRFDASQFMRAAPAPKVWRFNGGSFQ